MGYEARHLSFDLSVIPEFLMVDYKLFVCHSPVIWLDDHDFLTIWPTSRVSWSNGQKILTMNMDHGQNLKIAVVKWSKLVNFDHDHGQNLRISMVKWSRLVDFDH